MKLFLKLDGDRVVGLYDGSTDYVHRITGEPIQDANPIPDGSIPLSEADLQTYRDAKPPKLLRWDGAKIVSRNPETREEKERCVYMSTLGGIQTAEQVRIAGLTEAELDAIIEGI